MGTLVVGYDGSDAAGAALDHALELAAELGDRVVIAYGYDPGGPGEEYRATQEAVREIGEQVTAEAAQRARDAGVEVEVALRAERPVDALLARLRARGAADRRRQLRGVDAQGDPGSTPPAPAPVGGAGAGGPARYEALDWMSKVYRLVAAQWLVARPIGLARLLEKSCTNLSERLPFAVLSILAH